MVRQLRIYVRGRVCPSIHWFTRPTVCPLVHPSVRLSCPALFLKDKDRCFKMPYLCKKLCPTIHPSICGFPSVCLSINLSVVPCNFQTTKMPRTMFWREWNSVKMKRVKNNPWEPSLHENRRKMMIKTRTAGSIRCDFLVVTHCSIVNFIIWGLSIVRIHDFRLSKITWDGRTDGRSDTTCYRDA